MADLNPTDSLAARAPRRATTWQQFMSPPAVLRGEPAVYTVSQLRAIESLEVAQAQPALTERAGLAAARWLRALLAAVRPPREPVVVLAGPGFNGSDARCMAQVLLHWGWQVYVVTPQSAAAEWPPAPWAAAVDGLFGIGLARGLDAQAQTALTRLSSHRGIRLALDVPSGLEAGTGFAHPGAFQATHTLAFLGLTPGLFTADGPAHAGEVRLACLDLDPSAWPAPAGRLLCRAGPSAVLTVLTQPRDPRAHKGSFGSVAVVGGSRGMTGAATLAARAALAAGVGKVWSTASDQTLDLLAPECMHAQVDQLQALQPTVLAVGPGLGQEKESLQKLCRLPQNIPTVLDADALNLLACEAQAQEWLAGLQAPRILTPHPLEAARLLKLSVAQVQANRVLAACTLAQRWQCHLVLKGAGSVIAAPDGTWSICEPGHAGMASAGMGDALTGLMAGLWSQQLQHTESVAAAAVWWHALAGEWAADQVAGRPVSASQVIAAAREWRAQALLGPT